MKLKITICALALVAITLAAEVSAEARNFIPRRTTVQQLSNTAQAVVVARLDRVENVQLGEVGIDAKRWAKVGDGTLQNGEDNIRREGILKIEQVLKGSATVGGEVRFVSMRQLKFENYDQDLKSESAIWFLHARPEDNRIIVLSDERGTVTGTEVGGNFTELVDFVRDYVAGLVTTDRMLDAIDLKGGRLSVDCSLEFSWNHESYSAAMTEPQRQRIVSLAQLSPVGSIERNEMITAIGRYKPEGGLQSLLAIMLADTNWSTTSLGCWALEEIDRGVAIQSLLDEWPNAANDKGRQMVIVRALGLIRPKSGYDGLAVRTATLDLVNGLLVATSDKNLLREALIASRDLRTEQEHIAALKKLIDERDTNGLGDAEVKAAVIALAACRKTIHTQTGIAEAVYARTYLEELAASDVVLAQVINPALANPWVILIEGADGRGH